MRRRSVIAIGAAVVAVAGLVVTAVLVFPAGTVGRVSAGPTRLPQSLREQLFDYCLPDTTTLIDAFDKTHTPATGSTSTPDYLSVSTDGSGASFSATVEATGDWKVDADRSGIRVSAGAGGSAAAPAEFSHEAVDFVQKLYACGSKYRFVDETSHEATSSQLVQWYKYDVGVLWPCLRAHGLHVGDPPTRAEFSDPFRAQAVDPYQGLKLGKGSMDRVLAAVRDCPQRPPFLG